MAPKRRTKKVALDKLTVHVHTADEIRKFLSEHKREAQKQSFNALHSRAEAPAASSGRGGEGEAFQEPREAIRATAEAPGP